VLQISVNGTARDSWSAPENWGELLHLLENGEGRGRRVVTAVRFGGVAAPTFREPSTLARELHALEPIDIQISSVDELLHESAQSAFDSIAPLRSATARIASRLHAGHETAAVRDLQGLTTSIQTLTTITAGLGDAMSCPEPHRRDFDALVLRLCRLVDNIIVLQVRADWNGIAELLDRELTPTLEAWVLVARRVWSVA
jgi:hypothetical protein